MASTLAYLQDQAARRGAEYRRAARRHQNVREARRAYVAAMCRLLHAELAEQNRQPRTAGRFAPKRPILTTAADLFGDAA